MPGLRVGSGAEGIVLGAAEGVLAGGDPSVFMNWGDSGPQMLSKVRGQPEEAPLHRPTCGAPRGPELPRDQRGPGAEGRPS